MANQFTKAMFYENTIRTLDNIIKVATYCKEQIADARGNTPIDVMGRRATNEETDTMIRLDYALCFLYEESKGLGIEYTDTGAHDDTNC